MPEYLSVSLRPQHPVDGGVVGTSPSGVPIALLHWEVEVMFVEPEQRLPRAAKLLHFVEHELDRLLNAKVRVLLVAITRLHEADRRADDEFAAASLLVTS